VRDQCWDYGGKYGENGCWETVELWFDVGDGDDEACKALNRHLIANVVLNRRLSFMLM
jgi:hypothetical protein